MRSNRARLRSALAAVATGAIVWAGSGASSRTEGAEAFWQRIQATLDSIVDAAGYPGATLGVVLPDGMALGFASGMADTAKHEVMTPESRMLQGSVGKTYFGAVALQLVAEGRLDLDVPVADVFGDERWLDRVPNGRRVTLRQLMSHTSGLVRYELNPRFLEDLTSDPLRSFTSEERLSYLFDTEAPFAPGEGWDYSDTNYIVVAMLIERVTGRSAYDEIRRRFLTPLRLSETVPSDRPAVPGLVQGYAGADNPFGGFDEMVHDGRMRINPQFEWGGGGMASTARDLARWTHFVQTGRAFDRSLLDDFRAGHPAPLGPEASYGLGVIMMKLPAGRAWGHSGMMPGYRTEAYHFPDHGFTLALQVNTSAEPALKTPPLLVLSKLAAEVAGALEGEVTTPSQSEGDAREGVVTTAGGAPAMGAMVTAHLADGRSVTVYSDAAGRYALPDWAGLSPGVEARVPGGGMTSSSGMQGTDFRLSGGDPVSPSGAAWLATLPAGEESRQFILDCTGCHVTDASRTEVNGMRRDSAAWHAAVTLMTSMYGQGTGFPIISSWADPQRVSGWLARSFRDAAPQAVLLRGPSGAVLTEYPVPVPQDLPHDVMVDGSGQVLVTGMFTHQMYRLDPGTGGWETTPIPVPGANPRALDIDERGRWWVVLGGPGKVAVYDPPSDHWDLHDVGMYAHSIDIAPDGRAWVNGHFTVQPEVIAAVDGETGTIQRFTVPPARGGGSGESTIPYGLRVARNGIVWGTQLRGGHLVRLDPATGALKQWPMPVRHAGPRRPDIGPDGSVWIPLYGANALARFDPETEAFSTWDFPLAGALPYVVRVDQAQGTVWIGTGHGDVVASFDPRSESFTLFPLPTRGALIRHLDVDEERNAIWFAYGASPGIPGKILRLQPTS